jgi:hypothetical protein
MPVTGFGDSTAQPPKKYSSDPKTRARELVAEGRFGGRQPGAGRRRKPDSQKPKRASTVIVERLRENPELVASVIPDVMNDPDASRHMKLRAAKLAIDIEGREEEHRREDKREGRNRDRLAELPQDREALAEALAAKLASNPLLARSLAAVLARAGEIAGDSSQTALPAAQAGGDGP